MTTRSCLFLGLFLAMTACGSSDDGGGTPGTGGASGGAAGGSGSGGTGTGGTGTGGGSACTKSDDCVQMGCECANGEIFHSEAVCETGQCVPGEQVCEDACAASGGLVNSGPEGTVEDSPECAAFCEKVASLGCEDPTCNKSVWCRWQLGECPEGKIAELQCIVDQGTFQCMGPGWMYDGGGCLALKTQCD